MDIPFLDLRRSTAPMADELHEAARRVIDSGRFLHGPETELFESELAAFCGSRHAVGVSNGLDAIRLITRALIELGRLRPADKVVVPANTYIASILPLTEFGLVPVPVEPSESSFCLDLRRLAHDLPEGTKAVMAVHLYGNPCWDGQAARELASRGVIIIEDNAQAIGAKSVSPGLGGSHTTGALGHAAAHSFYPTKNLGALGDAGAVTTDDPLLADTIRALANYGSDRRYHNIYTGYNCRLSELQAAMLRVKLRHLAGITLQRQKAAQAYSAAITNHLVATPAIMPGATQVWHQYPVLSPRRDELRKWLTDNGVATDIHYAVPPHLQPCYAGKLGGPYPVTERIASRILSLPIADIYPTEAEAIAAIINQFS